jgi:hypothetical protein
MMKYRKICFILLKFGLLVLLLSSCNNKEIKFDKSKWNEQTDPLFPSSYRLKMLTDLTSNYKLVGFTYSQLIELLGMPDNKDSSSLSYKIVVDYGHDIDPVYTKNLDFIFSKDSVITSFKVDEWKKGR